jgi:hypothetical protein
MEEKIKICKQYLNDTFPKDCNYIKTETLPVHDRVSTIIYKDVYFRILHIKLSDIEIILYKI